MLYPHTGASTEKRGMMLPGQHVLDLPRFLHFCYDLLLPEGSAFWPKVDVLVPDTWRRSTTLLLRRAFRARRKKFLFRVVKLQKLGEGGQVCTVPTHGLRHGLVLTTACPVLTTQCPVLTTPRPVLRARTAVPGGGVQGYVQRAHGSSKVPARQSDLGSVQADSERGTTALEPRPWTPNP
eukprot:3941001-Rhodomonas_salina.2